MDCKSDIDNDETAITINAVNTVVTVDTMDILDTRDTEGIDDPRTTVDTVDTTDTADLMVTVDSMGSGDATSPPICNLPILTLEDVQDLILPDPSVVELLPPLFGVGELSGCDISVINNVIQSKEYECDGLPAKWEIQETDDRNILLSPKDIYDIQKFCAGSEGKDVSDTKFDLAKLEVLFRCEACEEMPISSETVHTCDFGHQVCGHCFKSGVRMCLVCKGHLIGNNLPLENVLRRLRQNYPDMFCHTPPSVGVTDDINYLSRFYSLKPLVCPHHGCIFRTSARGLFEHFVYEHNQVPRINLSLFEHCKVLVPPLSSDITTGTVLAAINLTITEESIASRLATNIMTCLIQCGIICVGMDKALALWVSCVYEEIKMPPILFRLRATTAYGYSSFGGQMTPLLDYSDPESVLASGRCLLLFPKDIENVLAVNNGSLVVELKFYLC